MKTKITLLAAIALFSFTASHAQAYAGIGVGYGVPMAGTVLGYNSTDNNPGNAFSTEIVRGSFGKGLNFGAYGGFMVNQNLGIELGVNYLLGAKYNFKSSTTGPNTSDVNETEAYARSLRLNPSVRFGFGDGNIRPYLRAGLSIGLMNKYVYTSTRTQSGPGGTDVSINTFEYTGGATLGFTGGFGATIALNDRLALFGELNYYFASWAPTKGKRTESTINGADQLPGMTTDQKEYEFVDQVDQTMNTSPSQPSKELKEYSPMSSIGISIGLHIAFGE